MSEVASEPSNSGGVASDPVSQRAARRAMLTNRAAIRHFLEMLVAMVVGMVALGPLWPDLGDRVELHTLVMATDMTIGMGAWMAYRRHGPGAIAEMGLAMYVPFVLLFPALWAGWLSGMAVMAVGHVLMLPAMVAAMLRRPTEYCADRSDPTESNAAAQT